MGIRGPGRHEVRRLRSILLHRRAPVAPEADLDRIDRINRITSRKSILSILLILSRSHQGGVRCAVASESAYVRNLGIFACPSAAKASSVGYTVKDDPTPLSDSNYQGNAVVMDRPLAVAPNPAEIVYLHENNLRWHHAWLCPALTKPKTGEYQWWHWDLGIEKKEQFSNLHSGGGNLVFVDGHAKYRHHLGLRSRDYGLVPDDGPEANANKYYKSAF